MLPFGGDGGDIWNLDAVAEENSDWVPTTTTALFSSPFYVTNHQGDLLGNQSHFNNASAVAGSSLRPADSAADTSSWFLGDFNTSDLTNTQWQSPPASTPIYHHALTSPSPTDLSANWSGQSNTGELLSSSSHLPGEVLGDTQNNKIDRRAFPPERVPLPRPISTGAQTPSPGTLSKRRSGGSSSVPPTREKPPLKPAEPKTTSPTKKRLREGIPRSPSTKKTPTRTPIQPNEEEQARRIHMAAYTRGTSLISETSSPSGGATEASSARRDNDLRAAETNLIHNMGAGRAPGVLRTPNLGERTSEESSLPLGKGFPIQIGSKLFRLSGASIMSDCQYNVTICRRSLEC